MIVSALNNRISDPRYPLPPGVPNTLANQAKYAAGPGQSTSTPYGNTKYNLALNSSVRSSACWNLIDAIGAVARVIESGSANPDVRVWWGLSSGLQPPAYYGKSLFQYDLTLFYPYFQFPRKP